LDTKKKERFFPNSEVNFDILNRPLGFETNYLEKQWLSKNIFRRDNELRNLKQTAEVNFGYLVQPFFPFFLKKNKLFGETMAFKKYFSTRQRIKKFKTNCRSKFWISRSKKKGGTVFSFFFLTI
jgi:hypothetical protein